MSADQHPEAASTTVRCRFCGRTYDLLNVEVTSRYADCSMFKTPCCGKQADDREWKSLPDFYRLTTADPWVDMYGLMA